MIVEWRNKALKQARKLPARDRQAIVAAVDELENWPDVRNVTPLRNHAYDYRLRVGRYRVLLNLDEVLEIISVEEVKKRDERTY